MASGNSSSKRPVRKKRDDPFHLEQKRLIEAQEALLREQERARRVIADAPKKLEELKKRQREPIKIRFNSTDVGRKKFGLPHDKFRDAASEPRRPRARKAERTLAKVQFIVSVVILAIILLMVWRTVSAM